MIAVFCALALSFAALLLLARCVRGPGPSDRLIAAHGLFVCAALIAATAGARDVRWIDAALALVLLGAGVVIAAVKIVGRTSFQTPLATLETGPLKKGAGR